MKALGLEQNTSFENLTEFADTNSGFSLARKLDNDRNKDHLSLMHVFINNKDFQDLTTPLKPLRIGLNYGRATERGITMRDEVKLMDPYDADFSREYYYEPTTHRIYDKFTNLLDGTKLLEKIYRRHIRSTKLISGLPLRIKVVFFRYLIAYTFSAIKLVCTSILQILFGDTYNYNYLLQKETDTGSVPDLSSNTSPSSKLNSYNKERVNELQPREIKQGETIDFFGIKVHKRLVIVYVIIHLLVYGWLYLTKAELDVNVQRLFENNFLTVSYVIFTVWVMDYCVRRGLKRIIKVLSKLEGYFRYKPLKL